MSIRVLKAILDENADENIHCFVGGGAAAAGMIV